MAIVQQFETELTLIATVDILWYPKCLNEKTPRRKLRATEGDTEGDSKGATKGDTEKKTNGSCYRNTHLSHKAVSTSKA